MRILVTGAAGLIGSHLCRTLRRFGHDVSGLDAYRPDAWPTHDPSAASDLRYRQEVLLSGTTVHRVDMVDREALRTVLELTNPECIVHLAGLALVTATERDPVAGAADILQSTVNILEAIRKSGKVGRFVYVSSSMVYGNFDTDNVDETSATRPINIYGGLKLAGETVTRAYLAGTDVQHVIVRPMAVYGPSAVNRGVIQLLCQGAFAGSPITVNIGADNNIDFTFVEDLCEGLSLCCKANGAVGETFNLSFGQARDLMEVAAIIKRYLPKTSVIKRQVNDTFRPKRGTLVNAKARRILGFNPKVSLEDGIARYLSYLANRTDGLRAG